VVSQHFKTDLLLLLSRSYLDKSMPVTGGSRPMGPLAPKNGKGKKERGRGTGAGLGDGKRMEQQQQSKEEKLFYYDIGMQDNTI